MSLKMPLLALSRAVKGHFTLRATREVGSHECSSMTECTSIREEFTFIQGPWQLTLRPIFRTMNESLPPSVVVLGIEAIQLEIRHLKRTIVDAVLYHR